ncbi:MAG: pyridoxal phosphate-dependent aminotransferase [Alphaproteobacteria bacterium]|nr:pyridoxal phosphate-dependent aminotransferase [Alphaproteobacteria bacterium]
MSAKHFTPLVASLPSTVPFVGPEAQERARGKTFRARIGANENVFGPSPKAVAAMQEAVAQTWMYADPENHDLKSALAAYHAVAPENIVVGEGIDGLLGYVARMFVEPGVKVVTSLGAYPTFNFHVAGYGGELVTVPYRDDRENPDALIDMAKRTGARLIYISNPDNPMGTWWGAEAISEMIANVPDGSLLVLDEAYGEFAPESVVPPLDVSNPNVLRFRTFSKARGMAGARIGYAMGEAELIKGFDKIRNHFGVNRIAQIGALASLSDEAYLAEVISNVSAARDRITAIAEASGLSALPSASNFVAVDCGKDGDFARAVLGALIDQDIFVRMPGVAPQDRCIRVGAGLPADLDAFEEAFPKALARG